ncbi:hypothetical protein [Methylobacterium oryzisoli]|uniref:hypothetical protein n=1 Tax=Methylobacterium oryzisoli TaxID=3385502 RepID=UPI003891D344
MGAAAPTRFEAACGPLRALAGSLGFPGDETAAMVACLRVLAASWADAPLADPPPWSGLGADASGCDLSLVLGGEQREIRVTVEAQGDPPSPRSYLAAALALSDTLEARYGADLSRLRAVLPVLADLDPEAAGVLWHGAVFRGGQAPWFKVYLHLMAAGRRQARATARAALDRLGLGATWEGIAARLGPDDDLLFLGFDLLPGDAARVKLYLRHAETDAARLAEAADPDSRDSVRAFVESLAGPGRIVRRGALSALHLRPDAPEPARVTTHLRLFPHCGASDAMLRDRLCAALHRLGLPSAPYEAAFRALGGEESGDGEGLHGWASLQGAGGRPAVTVYLSPRLYLARFGPVALAPERMWPSPVLGRLACASA